MEKDDPAEREKETWRQRDVERDKEKEKSERVCVGLYVCVLFCGFCVRVSVCVGLCVFLERDICASVTHRNDRRLEKLLAPLS